jgi:hypothetical protein
VLGALEMSSSDQQHGGGEARTRLRWTRQLHQQFVGAVSELGGAESKSIDRSFADVHACSP